MHGWQLHQHFFGNKKYYFYPDRHCRRQRRDPERQPEGAGLFPGFPGWKLQRRGNNGTGYNTSGSDDNDCPVQASGRAVSGIFYKGWLGKHRAGITGRNGKSGNIPLYALYWSGHPVRHSGKGNRTIRARICGGTPFHPARYYGKRQYNPGKWRSPLRLYECQRRKRMGDGLEGNSCGGLGADAHGQGHGEDRPALLRRRQMGREADRLCPVDCRKHKGAQPVGGVKSALRISVVDRRWKCLCSHGRQW